MLARVEIGGPGARTVVDRVIVSDIDIPLRPEVSPKNDKPTESLSRIGIDVAVGAFAFGNTDRIDGLSVDGGEDVVNE